MCECLKVCESQCHTLTMCGSSECPGLKDMMNIFHEKCDANQKRELFSFEPKVSTLEMDIEMC